MKKVNWFLVLLFTVITVNAQEKDNACVEKSTFEHFTNKVWFQVENQTGERKNVEYTFGMKCLVRCTLPNNHAVNEPIWEAREFYFSDSVEKEFDRKMVGKAQGGQYLIVNELCEDNKYCVVAYAILEPTCSHVTLKQVYPQGDEVVKLKSGQNKAVADDVMGKLTGKQWRNAEDIANVVYFSDNKMLRQQLRRTKGGWKVETVSYDFYLSNTEDSVFEQSKYRAQSRDGNFLTYKLKRSGSEQALSWSIRLITDKVLVIDKLSAPFDYSASCVYRCD